MESLENLKKQIERRKRELAEIINTSENLGCPDILEMSRHIDELLNNYYKFLGYLSDGHSFNSEMDINE